MIEGKASGALAITYTMCHLAPGNPYNAQTIQVPAAAVPGHRAHGDYLHACIVCSGASTAMSKLGTAPDGPPAEPCELTSRGSALPRLSEVIDGE
jgi:hypothetical protein